MCLNSQLVFLYVSIILYRYFPIVLIYVSFLLVKINIRISLVSIFSIEIYFLLVVPIYFYVCLRSWDEYTGRDNGVRLQFCYQSIENRIFYLFQYFAIFRFLL